MIPFDTQRLDATQNNRIKLIQDRQNKYRKWKEEVGKEKQEQKEQQLEEIWKLACENGKTAGEICLNFKELGYVSDCVYDFEKEFGVPLKKLMLNGNALSSLESLTSNCHSLCELSLASNHIKCLDADIVNLTHLTHLNLVRNGLSVLPDNFGELNQLCVLDLSNNKLCGLPKSLCELTGLSVLRVECNLLTQLPADLDKMNLVEINVNANQLTTLPKSIGGAASLQRLLANDNKLRSLPIDICSSFLKVLHLSRNKITELPKAFTKLESLEHLWLDYNQLAALPIGFHKLVCLKELKLEGNKDLVFPPIHVVAKGTREVLKWCEMKYASKETSRTKYIILSVLSVLEQVGSYKVSAGDYRLHESIFEQDVEYNGEMHFQFSCFSTFFNNFIPAMEKLWSESKIEEAKRVINSFPYERMEVEDALVNFRDAGGEILHYAKKAFFRRCSCQGIDGKRRVCVPPKIGWACCRPAILVRSHFVLESAMVERKRITNEEGRLQDAAFAAGKEAKEYLNSSIGVQAVEEFASHRIKESGVAVGEEISSIAIDQIHVFDESIRSRPEMKQAASKRTSLVRLATCKQFRKHKDDRLAEEIIKVRDEYITNEIQIRRSQAQETNAKMKKVMDMWLGNTIEELFVSWKEVVRCGKIDRDKSRGLREEERQRLVQEEIEKNARAKEELSLWAQAWDDFNDRIYWIHSTSGEVSQAKPTLDVILNQRLRHARLEKISRKGESSRHLELRNVGNPGGVDKEAYYAADRVFGRRKTSLSETNSVQAAGKSSRYLR